MRVTWRHHERSTSATASRLRPAWRGHAPAALPARGRLWRAWRDTGALATSGPGWRATRWLENLGLLVLASAAVTVALVTGSAAAGLLVVAYGVVAHLAWLRSVERKRSEQVRARSLELLANAAADLRAGAPMGLLLLPDPELERLARAAQRMSDRVGAPLAELMERLETQQRELSRARAAAHAQAAGMRLTTTLLASLPLVALALGHSIGADAFGVLLTTPLGSACLALAAALQLGGLAWAGRLAGQKSLLPRAKRGLRRLVPDPVRVPIGEELAAAADLIASALRAGSPVSTAVLAAGEAMAGPLTRQLLQVGHQLRLGISAEQAWQPLLSVDPHGAGRQLADAAKRSAQSGAALARALTRCADDLRARARDSAQTRLQRSAVWLVLPLGLCFLPAFLLAGLVPVILAVLGEVL